MVKNPENKASSMDDLIAVHECMVCSALAANMAYVTQYNIDLANYALDKESGNLEFDLKNLTENPSKILENMDEDKTTYFLEKLQNFNIYDSIYEELATKYLFPAVFKKDLKLILNLAAYNYLSLNGQVWLKKVLPAIEKEIEQLVSAAERFSYYMNPVIQWGDNYDMFFHNQPVQKMLHETKANLDEILTLKDNFRASAIGKLAKLDDHRPMGNLGLHEFIKIMWMFWHDCLGRTVVQKYDGINGRKQFLEFLGNCLEPIHPKLVEDHFVGGAIDNALKKFQKELKS